MIHDLEPLSSLKDLAFRKLQEMAKEESEDEHADFRHGSKSAVLG